MKKITLITIMSLFIIAACNDDGNNGITPAAIQNPVAIPDYGAVKLSWTAPDTVNFYYVDVAWTDANGKLRRTQASRYGADKTSLKIETTLEGFSDIQSYIFTLTPYSVTDTPGTPVTIQCAPLEPAYKLVAESVDVKDDFGGVIVNWKNPTDKTVYIDVAYQDSSALMSKTFTSKGNDETKEYWTDLPAGEKTFTISVRDRFKNRSDETTKTASVLLAKEFSKAGWSIPGYNATSNKGTIGYSSQAINEGEANKAIAIFDNNVNTFWHARWPDSKYPHWFIIDLGEEVTISNISMVRRQTSGSGQLGQRFFTQAGEADLSTVGLDGESGWNWVDQGHYSFEQNKTTPQSYRLINNPKARYIKVYFGTEDVGSSDFAQVGEMSVFGQ